MFENKATHFYLLKPIGLGANSLSRKRDDYAVLKREIKYFSRRWHQTEGWALN